MSADSNPPHRFMLSDYKEVYNLKELFNFMLHLDNIHSGYEVMKTLCECTRMIM